VIPLENDCLVETRACVNGFIQ